MADAVPTLVILLAFGAVLGCLALVTKRRQGRRVGGSIAGPFEEIWHPAAHRARIDIEMQDERKIATPSPGEPYLHGQTRPITGPPVDRGGAAAGAAGTAGSA